MYFFIYVCIIKPIQILHLPYVLVIIKLDTDYNNCVFFPWHLPFWIGQHVDLDMKCVEMTYAIIIL